MKQGKNNGKQQMAALEKMLTFKYLDNSYKLLWVKSIVEEVALGNETIAFDTLAIDMLGEAWELVFVKQLTYGRLDKVHRILEEIDEIWHVDPYASREEAITFMKQIAMKELGPLLVDLYEDTPYRLLEPMYEAKLKGKKENTKNNLLETLINTDQGAMYQIDTSAKTIKMNKVWATWMKQNKKQIESLLKDSMAYYLDKNAGKR